MTFLISRAETITGSISAGFCLTVIFTYLLFKDIQNLRYVELVFYVALNEMIASIGISLGHSDNGTFACYFQSFTTNVNYLSSILWTSVITYQVWLIVENGAIIKKMLPFHCLCWLLPVVVTLVPLSTESFGSDDDYSNWCFYGNNTGIYLF